LGFSTPSTGKPDEPPRSARFARFANGDIDLCLVAYPFSVYRAEELRAFRGKICFIGGSLDDISPLDALLDLYREMPADKSLKVVPSGHTFDGEEPEITAFIREMFTKDEG
jgi:pimeloyl-ACP methyl ester carboxylesterase